jgi:PAS domain S-box-containing protein
MCPEPVSLQPHADVRLIDAKLGDLLESTPDAIIVVNGEGSIVLVNSLGEQLFGYDRDELVGQPIEALLPGRFRDAHVRQRVGYIAAPHSRTMGAGLDSSGAASTVANSRSRSA